MSSSSSSSNKRSRGSTYKPHEEACNAYTHYLKNIYKWEHKPGRGNATYFLYNPKARVKGEKNIDYGDRGLHCFNGYEEIEAKLLELQGSLDDWEAGAVKIGEASNEALAARQREENVVNEGNANAALPPMDVESDGTVNFDFVDGKDDKQNDDDDDAPQFPSSPKDNGEKNGARRVSGYQPEQNQMGRDDLLFASIRESVGAHIKFSLEAKDRELKIAADRLKEKDDELTLVQAELVAAKRKIQEKRAQIKEADDRTKAAKGGFEAQLKEADDRTATAKGEFEALKAKVKASQALLV
jgi:hypothetical protein